jgi:hypothetical protein
MSPHEISLEDVDALLEFLPLFERPGRTFARWGEVEKNADGSISLPFPVYDEDVEEFFRRVGRHGWIDYGYKPSEAGRMLDDAALVERASVEQIKTMLTFCLRAERFGDGNWEAFLKGGQIVALLRRLKALREQL